MPLSSRCSPSSCAASRRSACSARTPSPATTPYEPAEVLRWLVYHVAELDLYVGVFPFAALLVLLALWNRLPRSLRPFLAATASLSAFLLLEVSAFASLPSVQRIEERNLFYLAPLMLIALLVWVDQGAPRPPLTAGAAAVLAAALPAVIPYARLIGVPSQSDTLLMLALWRVHERWVELDEVVAVVVACSILAALAFLARAAAVRDRAPARRARVLPRDRATDLRADGVRRCGRARRGDAQAGPRVDRPGSRRVAARSACCGPATARASRSGRTSSSTAASAPSSTRARRWRAGSRRRR